MLIKEQKFMLKFSPDLLKNDENFIIRAVEANPDADEFIPEHLQGNHAFMQKIKEIKSRRISL